MRKSELIRKLNHLEEDYETLKKRVSALEWLQDHPSGIDYEVNLDTTTTFCEFRKILSVIYFSKDRCDGGVKKRELIRTPPHSDIEDVCGTYNWNTGEVMVNFTIKTFNMNGNDTVRYSYKSNLYVNNHCPEIMVQTFGSTAYRKIAIADHTSALHSYITL